MHPPVDSQRVAQKSNSFVFALKVLSWLWDFSLQTAIRKKFKRWKFHAAMRINPNINNWSGLKALVLRMFLCWGRLASGTIPSRSHSKGKQTSRFGSIFVQSSCWHSNKKKVNYLPGMAVPPLREICRFHGTEQHKFLHNLSMHSIIYLHTQEWIQFPFLFLPRLSAFFSRVSEVCDGDGVRQKDWSEGKPLNTWSVV